MFNWFKRKEKCKHFKSFGEKVPENMIELVRFSPYETDTWGYGISECNVCKKRAFACAPCHLMSPRECDVIDSFIAHKIDWVAFKEFLENNMAWYKEI